jgi:hypothetical protein
VDVLQTIYKAHDLVLDILGHAVEIDYYWFTDARPHAACDAVDNALNNIDDVIYNIDDVAEKAAPAPAAKNL